MERNQEGELFRQVLRSCQNPNNKLRCFCIMCLTLSSERVVKKKKKKSVMIVVLGVFFCFFIVSKIQTTVETFFHQNPGQLVFVHTSYSWKYK